MKVEKNSDSPFLLHNLEEAGHVISYINRFSHILKQSIRVKDVLNQVLIEIQ